MEKLNGNDLNRVMDDFDFEKVHAYMLLTKWTWAGSGDNEPRVPNIEKLRIIAEQFLWRVIEDPKETSAQGTGGFMAYKFPWGLKLSFEPFKSSTY